MPTGVVKWFNEQKGYGFAEQDDGADVFIHFSEIKVAVPGAFKTLNEGQRVRFDVEQSERGLKAVDVEVITNEAAGSS